MLTYETYQIYQVQLQDVLNQKESGTDSKSEI